MICPFANTECLISQDRPRLSAQRLTLHTAWPGPARGPLYHGRPAANGTFAHFYIDLDGTLYQHFDTAYAARADLDGNTSSISCETADQYTEDGLNAAQLATFTALWNWVLSAHPEIPRQLATPSDPRGLAGHRLGCSGNFGQFDPNDVTTWSGDVSGLKWSTVRGKICPGAGKLAQLPAIVNATSSTPTPALTSEKENSAMNMIKTTTPWGTDAYALIHDQQGASGLSDIEAVAYGQLLGRFASVNWDIYQLLVRQAWERHAAYLDSLGKTFATTIDDATARIVNATKETAE